MIPLVDLVAQYRSIQSEIDAAIHQVLEDGHFILGSNVTLLEHEVGTYLGAKHAVGVASGTDALVIALRALNIGPGDEVIVPSYSFFATAGAVMLTGARPVFVDIKPDTYCLDETQVVDRITSSTKAIIPVHLYGHPAEMSTLLDIARMHGLKVIEDNAQAFGAEYRERKTASLGDIGCLSFFPTKNLGGYGDGGMVITNDDELAAKVRILRTHGWRKKYFPEMLGYNSRLDELQAAILCVKLHYVDEWNLRRRMLASQYNERFFEMRIVTPREMEDVRHVYHLYTVRFAERDRVQSGLKSNGIASEVYYPQPLHLTDPCRQFGYQPGDFPAAEQASRQVLSLPLYPEMSEAQLDSVTDHIQRILEEVRA
ncbi:MAG: transcriptional regulator [Anaerolineales bacterium]|nr:DegT/DnrJ/EryC1/StrS family aminotransferase [Anaerolineae bacterium]PWB68780.1 MAG: transcriptional regulator [Anaerolineales bacterium]